MFVSGFSFVRNAVKLDYPVVEAMLSILPLVDEFVMVVGNSDDATLELINSIGDSKIRIVHSIWDDSLRQGGRVLAEETNKALAAINPKADWAIYIQGDECIHEKYYPVIQRAMNKYKDDTQVEGLLFKYLHFYGSFDFVADSRTWYRNEIRIVKNLPGVTSYKDAQGFRINDRKLRVKALDAYVYHYGWVRHPKYQMAKQMEANKFWHDDDWINKRFDAAELFDYSIIDSCAHFKGSHPAVMQKRINAMNWEFESDPTKKKFGLKRAFLYWLEKTTGWRVGEYKNYEVI
jgi:hypothetical protein